MRRVRKALGLTQKAMARRLGLSPETGNVHVSNMETGGKKLTSPIKAHLMTIQKYELKKPVMYDVPVRPVEVWMQCLSFLNNSKPGESVRVHFGHSRAERLTLQVRGMASRSKWNCKIEQNGAEIICTKTKQTHA